MKLCDVNVLIYAHRAESSEHEAYAAFIRELAEGPSAFGLSKAVLSAFVRIVTNGHLEKCGFELGASSSPAPGGFPK